MTTFLGVSHLSHLQIINIQKNWHLLVFGDPTHIPKQSAFKIAQKALYCLQARVLNPPAPH